MSPDLPGPDGGVPPDAVRAALARIQQSASFAHSPTLRRFLSFLVEETLAGRGERLKEYVIGLEVFARPASYDPRVDSLVRVEARRLRAAVASYYSGVGRSDPVVLELKKGTYLPVFRFSQAAVLAIDGPTAGEAAGPAIAVAHATPARASGRSRRLAALLLVLTATAAGIAGAARFLRSKPVAALTERDQVVVVDFTNTTGERIFDETLKQGLTTELEQSPFLNVVSERRITQSLKLMGRTSLDRLDRDQTRDLCLRSGGKVVITGSIHRLGSQYVVGLTACDCGTGDDFLHVQKEAARKEAVLPSLSIAASALRRRLGESLASVQQFGMPVEEATTESLEALQAYSLGRRTAREKGSPADVPFYKRALEIDPDFAAAHAALGVSYVNQGQPTLAAQHLGHAYRLRDRISERERYRVSAYYYQAVTGELEKAREVYELWTKSYPREFAPHLNLGLAHLWLGEYDKAIVETQEALRIEPGNVLPYTNLAALLIKTARLEEARLVLAEARQRNLVSTLLRLNLCYLGFLAGDEEVAGRQLAEVGNSPSDAAALLLLQADTAAYHGRLGEARALSTRALQSALQAGGGSEARATTLLNEALREAEVGEAARARRMIRQALDLSAARDVMTLAALASARAGDCATADRLVGRLQSQFPGSTVTTRYWIPTIRAASEFAGGRHAGARRLLQDVTPYDLASPPPIGLATLYPVYVRGEACLRERDPAGAARHFQTVLQYPGLVLNFPLHALARLQLARARAMAGDFSAAVRAYDEFLDVWKNADPDIPVLKQAQAERRRLFTVKPGRPAPTR